MNVMYCTTNTYIELSHGTSYVNTIGVDSKNSLNYIPVFNFQALQISSIQRMNYSLILPLEVGINS